MKFNKLILHGFKSFVDRTVIDFPDGVTAIVGPNGSGKSNILDAIRWVLGEQNPKELRGSDMDDIIFAGSENRKGSNIAYVTLVISDIEESSAARWGTFSEIEITRKYYRDGEREYYINNRRCKLKDIKELFYDTGLGARSISIIEQGKVEKIVSASPEEIRVFFDEAAGIVKFKEKKKEAEKRLEQSVENLQRVNDIIFEVKTNLDQLHLQVQDLRIYRELVQKKEKLEKIIFAKNFQSNLKQKSELTEKLNKLQIDLSGKIYDYESLRKEEDSLRKKLVSLELNLKNTNKELIEITEELGKLRSEVSVLENNVNNAEQSKINMQQELESIEKRLIELTRNREAQVKSKEQLSLLLDEKTGVLSEVEEQIKALIEAKESYEDEIDENRRAFLQLAEQASILRNQHVKTESEIARLSREIQRLNGDKLRLNEEVSALTNLIEENKAILEHLENDKTGIQNDALTLKEEISKLSSISGSLQKEIMELKASKMSRENILKKLEEDLKTESFGKELNKLFSIDEMGLLLDYDIGDGIRQFLGDAIVFKTGKDSVLQKINEVDIPLKFVFEDEIPFVIEQNGKREYKKIADGIIAVDNVYYKHGKVDKTGKILSMKNEISNLKEQLEKTDRTLTLKIEEQESVNARRGELSVIFEDKSRLINEFDKKIATINTEIKNHHQQKDILQKRDITVFREIRFNTEELEKLKEKALRMTEELASYSKKQKELEEQLESYTMTLKGYEEKIDAEKENLSDLRVEVSTLKEKLNSSNKDLLYIDKEISSATTKMGHLKDRLSKLLTVDLTNWKTKLQENRLKIDHLEKKRIETELVKNQIEQDLAHDTSMLKELGEKIEKNSKETRTIENAISNINMKLVEYKTIESNLRETFFDQFKMNLDEVYTEFCDDSMDISTIKEEIRKIDEKVASIGPLNMGAERDYLEMEERYQFLSRQKSDLDEAIKSIKDIIDEIDKKTADSFFEAYNSIRMHFKDIFKILFGEGKADITLTNEHDLLNTGVEIFVQPPGKKLQNMALLSGGEKAMTACVLLFAMFLYKPSPFCFLDEIDAPLDDANIGRFCSILKEMAKKAQFVVITHNQKTMEAADQLYGVTMQEPGVSKVISARLG